MSTPTNRTEYLTTRQGQGVEGALGGYAVTKMGLAALTRFGAAAVPGAGWIVAAGSALGFLWGLTRGRKTEVSTIREAGISRVPVQQGPVPYLIGRSAQKGATVLAKNASQTWSDGEGNAQTLANVELHLVIVLGKGPIEGFDVKLDGKFYALDHVVRENGQRVAIVRDAAFRRNVVFFPMLEADGRPCESLIRYLPQYWTPAHQLNELSYVHVYMAQGGLRPFQLNSDWRFTSEPNSGRFLQDFPKVEIITRGRKGIVTPTNPEGAYTENWAEAVYDYLTNIREPRVSPEDIDEKSFREAVAHSGQWLKWPAKEGYADRGIRYAAGGIIYSDDSRDDVERQLGFASSGGVLQRGDKWFIRAGKQPDTDGPGKKLFEITDKHIDPRGPLTIRASSPLEQRSNKLTCTIPQSDEQDFSRLKVSYEDADRILVDGEFLEQDIREIGFVPNPYQAGRCLHNLLKLSYGRVFTAKLKKSMELYRKVRASNFVVLNVKTPRPFYARCIVDETQMRSDWSLDVVLVEVLPDAFEDVTIHPPDKTREDQYTITGYKAWGGREGFQGVLTNAFRWEAGFSGYEMIIPSTALDEDGPNVVWDNLDNEGRPQWPFGDFALDSSWESPTHLFTQEAPDGQVLPSGFNSIKVDVALRSPEDLPSGSRALPTEPVSVEVRGFNTNNWYQVDGLVSGKWAELKDHGIPNTGTSLAWCDGIRVKVPLGGVKNSALTGVIVAVGQPLGGGADSSHGDPIPVDSYQPPTDGDDEDSGD